MKIREGFVSNSSSSSFVVKKKDLSDLQHFAIVHHIKLAMFLKKQMNPDKYSMYEWLEEWNVEDRDDEYYCETFMDNFPLDDFLRQFDITLEEEWHS